MNSLMAVDVGGKTRFGAWIRLFRSYSSEDALPVRWLAVADAVDAATDLARGARDAGVVLPAPVAAAFRRIPGLYRNGLEADAIDAARALNQAALISGARVGLAPVDLEHLMLAEASPATCRLITDRIGIPRMSQANLLRKLGSQVGAGPSADRLKHPWIRSLIGQLLPPAEISADVRLILSMWMRGAIEDDAQIAELLDALR
jgi:hypothetical protein